MREVGFMTHGGPVRVRCLWSAVALLLLLTQTGCVSPAVPDAVPADWLRAQAAQMWGSNVVFVRAKFVEKDRWVSDFPPFKAKETDLVAEYRYADGGGRFVLRLSPDVQRQGIHVTDLGVGASVDSSRTAAVLSEYAKFSSAPAVMVDLADPSALGIDPKNTVWYVTGYDESSATLEGSGTILVQDKKGRFTRH